VLVRVIANFLETLERLNRLATLLTPEHLKQKSWSPLLMRAEDQTAWKRDPGFPLDNRDRLAIVCSVSSGKG